MLKILSFLATILMTTLAEGAAFSLDCVSPKGFSSHGHTVKAVAHGVWETLEFGHARLNYSLSYGLDCIADAASCWSFAVGEGQGTLAQRDYAPTRYQGFDKFAVDAFPGQERRSLLLPAAVPQTAGSFMAYLQLDGVKGSYGTTVPLFCEGQSVKSQRSSLSEQAAAELARADSIIQHDYGFPDLHLHADAVLLQKQIDHPSGDLSLSAATSLALALILDDFKAVESPLNIAADGGAVNQEQEQSAQRLLREQMLHAKTTLSIYLGSLVQGETYPPEYGENEQTNWIFVLRVPTLSDHIYWVIVDKKGQVAPYLYGFN